MFSFSPTVVVAVEVSREVVGVDVDTVRSVDLSVVKINFGSRIVL